MKSKKKITIAERFYALCEILYELIKNSLFFWWYWLKGFGVANTLASIEALSKVSRDIYRKERRKTRLNFKENFSNQYSKMFLSLGFTGMVLFGVYLFTLSPSYFQSDGMLVVYFLYFFISFFILLLLFTKELLFFETKWNLILHVYFLGRKTFWCLLYLLLMVGLSYLSLWNVIFMIGFAPGIIGYFGVVLAERMKETVKI